MKKEIKFIFIFLFLSFSLLFSHQQIFAACLSNCAVTCYFQPNCCPGCGCCQWVTYSCGSCGCPSSQRCQVYTCYSYTSGSVCSTGSTRCVSSSSCPTPTPACSYTGDCGHKCAASGCDACACDGDSRSSAYNWSSLGCSKDCRTCYCGTLKCTCSSWTARSCGGGSCGSLQRQYTRDCNPDGCQSESRCENDSSCCQCSSWTNQGCGLGGCALNRMYQTRSCSPSGCSSTTNCTINSACASSCTISLTPNPLQAFLGESTLLTASVVPSHATVSRVEFSSDASIIASVNPSSDSDDPYRTSIFGNQIGSATVTARAILSPEGSCAATVPVTVESAAWFQTQGGNVYSGGELTNNIPQTADVDWIGLETENDQSLSLELNNWPGMIIHQDNDQVELGDGYPSLNTSNHWLIKSSYKGKPYGSFEFFQKKFAMEIVSETYGPERGDLPNENGVYYAKSSRMLTGDWSAGRDDWVVLMVEGDVTVDTNITVTAGGFLVIVATGDISFADDITQIQGMFVADGTINTGEGANPFAGEGIFIANNFSLSRNFRDVTNRTTPIETFKARPDFIMSSYKDATYNVWWFFQKWQEIAP